MALTDETGGMNTTMLVSPNGNVGGGDLFGGNSGWWIILLFILLGGWGGGFGGAGGFDGLYPWMNNSQNVNNGFRDQTLYTQISSIQNGITSGFGDLQTALCGGFAGVNASITGAQNALTQQMYTNTIADMERSYGIQTQLQNCCCENRAATLQTQTVVQNEGNLTRAAIQSQTQAILDKMCQQEIDALKSQNLALQNQVNMQALAASQATQTAALIADNTAQTQYIVNRVAPYPIPAYTVANPVTPAA